MSKFGKRFESVGEPVVDIRKILKPSENKSTFQNSELESLFGLSAIESLSLWNAMTVEKLWILIGEEKAISDEPEAEIKNRLVTRISLVEKGLIAIKNSYPTAVESTLIHLRALRSGL